MTHVNEDPREHVPRDDENEEIEDMIFENAQNDIEGAGTMPNLFLTSQLCSQTLICC